MQVGKTQKKNPEKMFCSSDKCICIVCIHLSLLIRESLSQPVTVLRKAVKNFHASKSDLCNSITSTVITEDDKRALIKIESVFQPIYMSPVESSSQTGVCRQLSKRFFRGR